MIFKVEKKDKKAIKFLYNRLEKCITQEKPFTTEPKENQKTTVKKEENINFDSSDGDDITDLESPSDSGSNPNSENQPEIANANIS